MKELSEKEEAGIALKIIEHLQGFSVAQAKHLLKISGDIICSSQEVDITAEPYKKIFTFVKE